MNDIFGFKIKTFYSHKMTIYVIIEKRKWRSFTLTFSFTSWSFSHRMYRKPEEWTRDPWCPWFFFKEHTHLPSPSQALMPMAFSPPSLPPTLCPGQLNSGTVAPSCLPTSWISSCLGTSGPAASQQSELGPQLNQQRTSHFLHMFVQMLLLREASLAVGCCSPYLFFLLIWLFDSICLTYLLSEKAESMRTGTLFHSLFTCPCPQVLEQCLAYHKRAPHT